jgi:hypothetical protein
MNRNFWLPVLSFVLMAPFAQAQTDVLDQLQPIASTAGGVYTIGGASEQKLAQTVTVGIAGDLSGLLLPLHCPSGRLTIEIRNVVGGSPGTALLRRRRFDAEDLPFVGYRFRLLGMGKGLSFAEGDRFAIVLLNTTGGCSMARGPVNDAYAGGSAFFDARPNPPGWLPITDRPDLPFMTLMKTP